MSKYKAMPTLKTMIDHTEDIVRASYRHFAIRAGQRGPRPGHR